MSCKEGKNIHSTFDRSCMLVFFLFVFNIDQGLLRLARKIMSEIHMYICSKHYLSFFFVLGQKTRHMFYQLKPELTFGEYVFSYIIPRRSHVVPITACSGWSQFSAKHTHKHMQELKSKQTLSVRLVWIRKLQNYFKSRIINFERRKL